ncbi:chaperone modulator CbpM [Acidocella sp.]|uniref:chaperone modulator CbpM n=1 Tax=Acidocella sp. TaxID=50710 RepID=UPI00261A2E4F|nr:chaperone modulator CbpM [Acidocella sp.]
MIAFESLHIAGLDEAELMHWIDAAWVRARGVRGAWQFEEVDVARIQLIHTLRHDLEIGETAMPVVLSLLDQLYEMRRNSARLNKALASLPPEARQLLLAKLER